MYPKYTMKINLRDFLNNVNISLVNRYVYFAIGGAGNSSIKYILQTLEIENTPFNIKNIHDRLRSPLLSPYQLLEQHFEDLMEDESITKFGFVTNPYTRLVSAYLDRVSRLTVSRRRLLRELDRSDGDVISFKDFLTHICNQPDQLNDPHWRPQSSELLVGIVPLSKFGRTERFKHDAMEILISIFPGHKVFIEEELSNYPETVMNNPTMSLHDRYQDVDMELFMKKYEKDFSAFDYSTDMNDTVLA